MSVAAGWHNRHLHISSRKIPEGSILLELPVPFREIAGEVCVEEQAFQGLCQWLENFTHVTLCAPIVPEIHIDPSWSWKPVSKLKSFDRFDFVLLPWGYEVGSHLLTCSAVKEVFQRLIPNHRYLCFSNLGWLGGWGSVAATVAWDLRRPYAVWLDWVLHEVDRQTIPKSWARSIWRRSKNHMLRRYSERAVSHAYLGLFHGESVHEYYRKFCENSHVVHDIHLQADDVISMVSLRTRLDRMPTRPIRIVYVGRAHPIKGPIHWLSCLALFKEKYPEKDFSASWIGGGELLDEMSASLDDLGLREKVNLVGNVTDRAELLARMRSADIFLFCHLTAESPRCLIEALMCGLPIVGFSSKYAEGLVRDHGGGAFSAGQSSADLADVLNTHLESDLLTEMSFAARRSGSCYSEDAVFKHRSELIKQMPSGS